MIDPWIVIAIILAIALFICLANRNSLASKVQISEKIRRESEKIRRDVIRREGMPVTAKVTKVTPLKDRRQYQVFASWQSRETGRMYNFQETYMYPTDAQNGYRPKIGRGDFITVWVILDQPTNFIERNW
jgi:hypothetical protein